MKITAISKDEAGTTVYISAKHLVRIHIETNGQIEFCATGSFSIKEESDMIKSAIAAAKRAIS